MAHIEPFRAFRYDPAKVELADVATQPYDKISASMQDRYYGASPYNLVRIILGKRQENDGPAENPYTRAANFFREWREQEILRQDREPSIYRYVQRFSPPLAANKDLQFERHGFIALGKIEDYSAGVVFRHEQTLAKPKADRLDLLRATRAHFGQIFMLYSDPAGEIEGAIGRDKRDRKRMAWLLDRAPLHGLLESGRRVAHACELRHTSRTQKAGGFCSLEKQTQLPRASNRSKLAFKIDTIRGS